MSALAQQFGPGLLVATLAAPLVVLAVFLAPRLARLARSDHAARCGARARRRRARDWRRAVRGRTACAAREPLARSAGRPAAPAAALVWLIVSIFALREGQGRPNADRFAVAWLLTMAGSLGVFIAADLLTFYLVYALVSVPAYYLVAHDEDASLAPRRRRLYGVCAARRGGAA